MRAHFIIINESRMSLMLEAGIKLLMEMLLVTNGEELNGFDFSLHLYVSRTEDAEKNRYGLG